MCKNIENKENKTTNSLIRKTKNQLVEIILRKDSVEKELRTKITELETNSHIICEKLYNLTNKSEKLVKQSNMLKSDYEELCDKYADMTCEYDNKLKSKSHVICILTIIFIISVISNICLILI